MGEMAEIVRDLLKRAIHKCYNVSKRLNDCGNSRISVHPETEYKT